MDIAGTSVNFAMLRDHLQLFAVLLLALPLVSFLGFEFWLAARASKTQRTTDWFVPTDLDSDAARMHYEMGRQSVAFAHQPRRPAVRRPRSRGRS